MGVGQYRRILLLLATKQLHWSNWNNPRPESSQLASFEFKNAAGCAGSLEVKVVVFSVA